MEHVVDVMRFAALVGTSATGGLLVRAAISWRGPAVWLAAAVALCVAPVVAQAVAAHALTWQLVSVTVGVVLAMVALASLTRPVRRLPIQLPPLRLQRGVALRSPYRG